jgi:hypothetical protein
LTIDKGHKATTNWAPFGQFNLLSRTALEPICILELSDQSLTYHTKRREVQYFEYVIGSSFAYSEVPGEGGRTLVDFLAVSSFNFLLTFLTVDATILVRFQHQFIPSADNSSHSLHFLIAIFHLDRLYSPNIMRIRQ